MRYSSWITVEIVFQIRNGNELVTYVEFELKFTKFCSLKLRTSNAVPIEVRNVYAPYDA